MSRPLSDAALRHLQELPSLPELGTDRYRLLEPLGSGGMGAVWLAQDLELERPVAIKITHATHRPADLGLRLVREAHILAQLEHPGIVPVHAVGEMPDGRVYYVMKRVRGVRLDEAAPVRPLASRLDLFRRVCETVAFAHAAGIVHRDLKPENIMVGEFGEVLVLDWGVAKRITCPASAPGAIPSTEALDPAPSPTAALAPPPDSDATTLPNTLHTERGAIVGTPAYMAPEQAREDGDVGPRADVYALGGVLHFLVTGRAPDRSLAPLVIGQALGKQRPAALQAVLSKAMSADPQARYASVGELADEVARFQAGEPVHAYREGWVERGLRVAGRYRIPILIVLGYLAVRTVLFLVAGR